MKTLREVAVGQTVKVTKLVGEGPVKRRIMDMGITKGVEIYVRKVAPLGDPVEPVSALNNVVFPLFGLPANAILTDIFMLLPFCLSFSMIHQISKSSASLYVGSVRSTHLFNNDHFGICFS